MPIRTASEYLAEASELVSNPKASSSDLGRAKVLTSLAELASAGWLDSNSRLQDFRLLSYAGDHPLSVAQLYRQSNARILEHEMDVATLEFFSGKRSAALTEEKIISTKGGRIEEKVAYRLHGRAIGAVSELRDFSRELGSYTGLDEGTWSAGGYSVPVGFIPQVFHALKRTDQILEAANWDTTATADADRSMCRA
jgi:hypothetical protein